MGFGQYTNATYGNSLATGQPRAKQKKFVFGDHSNTCHVWAQQNEATREGRSSDGRIRFDGPTIYSYGSHFPIAHFTEKKFEGRRIVLVESAGYSTSTGKHKSLVRGALRGLPIWQVSVDGLKALLDRSLDWSGKGKRAKLKRELFETALESLASAERDTNAGRHWATSPREAREELQALKVALDIGAKIPDNVVAWSDERRARRERERDAKKLGEAIAYIRGPIDFGLSDILPATLRVIPPDERRYTYSSAIREISEKRTKCYRVRAVLGKAKRYPGLVKRASKAIKLLTAALAQWKEGEEAALHRERREADLQTLQGVREWRADATKSGEPRGLWNYEETARLAALAYSQGDTELGDYLRDNVSLKKWRQEVPETFKVETYGRPTVTREEWLAGKGDASAFAHVYGMAETLLRRQGDELQTSRGARCPWPHAVAAFEIAQRCRATQETFTPNGHTIRVGHFSVDRIEPCGDLHAGCHHLDFAEMLRLAIREVPERVRPCYPLPALLTLPTDNPLIDFDPSQGEYVA